MYLFEKFLLLMYVLNIHFQDIHYAAVTNHYFIMNESNERLTSSMAYHNQTNNNNNNNNNNKPRYILDTMIRFLTPNRKARPGR